MNRGIGLNIAAAAWLLADDRRTLITYDENSRDRLRKEFPQVSGQIFNWEEQQQKMKKQFYIIHDEYNDPME